MARRKLKFEVVDVGGNEVHFPHREWKVDPAGRLYFSFVPALSSAPISPAEDHFFALFDGEDFEEALSAHKEITMEDDSNG